MRQHDRVVLLLAGLQPGPVAERAGAGQLGAQIGRDTRRLLVVAARDPDEARLERVEVVRLLEGAQLLEQLAELGSDLELVRDPVQRRALLGARVGARRRHLRLLVPGEEARGLLEVVDLAQPAPELVEAFVHRALTRRSVTVSSEVSRRTRQELPGWTRNVQCAAHEPASPVPRKQLRGRCCRGAATRTGWEPIGCPCWRRCRSFWAFLAGTCVGSPRSLGRSGSHGAL